MTKSLGINKKGFNHNKGWSRDLFTDVVTVQGTPRFIFLSGVGSEDPEATELHTVQIQGANFEEQCRVSFRKIKTILSKHGATFHDVVRMTAYVTDARNMETYFRVQGEELDGAPRPPHTFLQIVALAAAEMLVEIEVTAMV